MKNRTAEVGGICQSLQGRDKGRFYMVSEIKRDGKVAVVDGNFKKLLTPKIKNVKHLRFLPEKSDVISSKLTEGRQVYDSEIYSALKAYNRPEAEQNKTKNPNVK